MPNHAATRAVNVAVHPGNMVHSVTTRGMSVSSSEGACSEYEHVGNPESPLVRESPGNSPHSRDIPFRPFSLPRPQSMPCTTIPENAYSTVTLTKNGRENSGNVGSQECPLINECPAHLPHIRDPPTRPPLPAQPARPFPLPRPSSMPCTETVENAYLTIPVNKETKNQENTKNMENAKKVSQEGSCKQEGNHAQEGRTEGDEKSKYLDMTPYQRQSIKSNELTILSKDNTFTL